MQDHRAQLEKLRSDAAECKLIGERASDTPKRALFERLAAHLGTLADDVEQEMLSAKSNAG